MNLPPLAKRTVSASTSSALERLGRAGGAEPGGAGTDAEDSSAVLDDSYKDGKEER